MSNPIFITQDMILPLMSKGEFFTVDFIKKNGEFRSINGRLGVKKYTNGKGLKFSPVSRGMVPVWERTLKNRKDEKDSGYRMVVLSEVIEIRIDDKVYKVKK